MAPEVWVGIGSNQGNRQKQLFNAIRELNNLGTVGKVSSIYETEPWGVKDQSYFLNMVCSLTVKGMTPHRFLTATQAIEKAAGRIRSDDQWGPRPLDIDLLFWDDEIIGSTDLIVPHPEICFRKFVLVPLCEVAPDLIHTGNGKKISEILAECNDSSKVSKAGRIDIP